MRSGRTIFWICTILTLCGCQLNTNNNISSNLGWVELQSPEGWVLTVYENGAGCLHCRAVGQCRVCFSPGTFSYADLFKDASRRPLNEQGGFRISMISGPEQDTHNRPIADTLWAAHWFEEAYAQVLSVQSPRQAQRRLRKHWQTSPPEGVANTSAW